MVIYLSGYIHDDIGKKYISMTCQTACGQKYNEHYNKNPRLEAVDFCCLL